MTAEAFNQIQDELTRARNYIGDLQEQLQIALAGKVPEDRIADAHTIWVESIISHRTKEGLVNIRWGNMSAQFSVKESRRHAINILEAADAAMSDSCLARYFGEKMDFPPEKLGIIIADIRHYRDLLNNADPS